MNKNEMMNINPAIAQAHCNLNTTNILNNISEYSTQNIRNKQIDILWDAIEILQKQINNTPKIVKLTCMNCGGQVEQKYDDYIFKCPYCKTVYALGTKQIYKN